MPRKATRMRDLRHAITTNWTQHTEYHFSRERQLDDHPIRCDWYPSTRTWVITSPHLDHNNTYKRHLPQPYAEIFYNGAPAYDY